MKFIILGILLFVGYVAVRFPIASVLIFLGTVVIIRGA